MANSYYTQVQTFIDGQILYAVDLNDELAALVAGLDKLPTPEVVDGEGFTSAVKVGTATLGAHAVRLDQLQAWPVTDLDPGTATALQYLTVSGDGLSVVGAAAPAGGGAGGDTPAGFTATSSATDVTLTSSSTATQGLDFTAVDKSVNLPDATTLTTGGIEAYLYNNGKYAFAIRDNDADLVAYLRPKQGVAAMVLDNGTAAGTWGFIGKWEEFSKPVPQIVNDGDVMYFSACALSSTEILQTYAKDVGSSQRDYKCVVLTRTAEAIAFGTPATIDSAVLDDVTATDTTATIKLTGSKAIVFYIDDDEQGNSEQYGMYSVVTVSGGVPTPGTATVWRAGTGDGTKMVAGCNLDTDKGLVVWVDNAGLTDYVACQVVNTTSGVVFGAEAQIKGVSSAVTSLAVDAFSATKAIVTWVINGQVHGRVVTISGDTATAAGTGSVELINDDVTTSHGVDVATLDADTFLTLTYAGDPSTFWQPIVAASNIDGSNNITTEEWSPPLGSAVYPGSGGGDVVTPSVQISKLSADSAALVVPAQQGWMTGVPLAVRATWDTTQFHFSAPEEVVGTGEVIGIDRQHTTWTLQAFDGEPYKLALFYRISATDYRAMHIEVAK